MVLAGFNLRTAVTSVGPVLDELEAGTGISGAAAGLLTTMPVLSFALLGSLTPRLARRLGERRVLAGALLMMAVGLAARSQAGSGAGFLLLSVPALAGGAMGNVLLPVIVKRHPDRIGALTSAYTTAIAVGTTAAAALTVPIAGLVRAAGAELDWRLGLGVWALPALVAGLLWGVTSRHERPEPRDVVSPRPSMWHSPRAWAFALFFGAQSMQAYIAFGWFALFFREQAGASATRAGLLVATYAVISVPVALVLPRLTAGRPDQRPVLAVLVALYALAYAGMLVAPGGAWLWVVLCGTGAGTFPLALTMIGLRTRTPAATAALSAFAQSIGYLLAGSGPLLVGVLHGRPGQWGGTFVLLYADLGVLAVAGWSAARPGSVDDDLHRQRR